MFCWNPKLGWPRSSNVLELSSSPVVTLMVVWICFLLRFTRVSFCLGILFPQKMRHFKGGSYIYLINSARKYGCNLSLGGIFVPWVTAIDLITTQNSDHSISICFMFCRFLSLSLWGKNKSFDKNGFSFCSKSTRFLDVWLLSAVFFPKLTKLDSNPKWWWNSWELQFEFHGIRRYAKSHKSKSMYKTLKLR